MKRIAVVRTEKYRAVRQQFWTFCEAKAELNLEFDSLGAKVGAVASVVFPYALMKARS
jgi:hypothetical protein